MIEQLLCWIFGFALLGLAFRFVHKEKYKLALATGIAMLAVILNGMTWFQGLMKTQIISITVATLKHYGERLDAFQKITEELASKLAEQQAQLAQHQRDIDRQQDRVADAQLVIAIQQTNINQQFEKMGGLQAEVVAAQKDIIAQQRKLDDVEFIAKNLFGNTRYEQFDGASPHVLVHKYTNGAQLVIVKLPHCPIPHSIQGFYQHLSAIGGPSPLLIRGQALNVATMVFSPNVDARKLRFHLQYVQDTRSTNLIKNVEIRGEELLLDGEASRMD